ncbi:MAG: hypothetical protein HZB57_08130 [Gammaproteobacteria bacterium]|nr:hypothetical protein [Gammaproteobacteria bacterium]
MNDISKIIDVNPILAMDEVQSQAELGDLLNKYQQRRAELAASAPTLEGLRVELDIAETLLGLRRNPEAWDTARAVFDHCVAAEAWQEAVEACDILYRSELDRSIVALGNGVWLAVTYPIKPQTSVALLHHIVDETPDKSDGGAVAAMAAHYLADLRTRDNEHEHSSLTFLTTQILAKVAKRHRGIEGQEMLNTWIEILQLNDPNELLPRLGKMLEAMVDGDWWYDRDALRARLPQD